MARRPSASRAPCPRSASRPSSSPRSPEPLPAHLAGTVGSRRSVSGRWSIHLCGELRVELAGERREAQLRGRQGRLAFAFLVLHRSRPIRRDQLIEALWAHEGAPPSETALAPVLSRLRRAVEPAVIEGRESLRLVFPEPIWVDVEAISEQLAVARAGLDANAAQVAATLAEPGLLPGLDAPWLNGPRNDLEELRVEALELITHAG